MRDREKDRDGEAGSWNEEGERAETAGERARAATPGCRIFVADRGAVRFDIPHAWIARGDTDGIKLYDREPPRNACVLAVSYRRIPPIDWTGLPLSRLVIEAAKGESRTMERWGDVVEIRRSDLEIAWRQGRFIDAGESRAALTRLCLGRRRRVQCLITMDFREEHLERFSRVWNIVLGSLQLDEPIEEPFQGAAGDGGTG